MRNVTLAAFPSAARTADGTYFGHNESGVGAVIVIDVTALTASPSVVFTLKGHDPASGKTWDILASAAIVATGTTVLRVHPALAAVANLVAKDMMPPLYQIVADHGDADSITYSVGVSLIAG